MACAAYGNGEKKVQVEVILSDSIDNSIPQR